jgi:hypothetical protein
MLRRKWVWLVLSTLLVVLTLIAVSVARVFLPSSPVKALRRGFMQSDAGAWHKQIHVRVGWPLVPLARAGLGLVHLDSEARNLLQTVHVAEVGVYRRHGQDACPHHSVMLAGVEKAMSARGWERLLVVGNGDDLVAVYVPSRPCSIRDVKFCLAVRSGRELIVGSARGNLEPLTELLLNRAKSEIRKNPKSEVREWHPDYSSASLPDLLFVQK